MIGAIIEFDDLRKISRLGERARLATVARWAKRVGIRYQYDGRGGICTTLDAMNAALGVRRESEPQQVAGEDAWGTISYVSARFWESTEFAEKSAATRRNYKYCAQVVREFKTEKGNGPPLDRLYIDRLSFPVIQAIVETIAKGRKESAPGAGDEIVASPSKANHLLRYFRVLFGWGMGHGHCKTNPAKGAKQVKERKRHEDANA